MLSVLGYDASNVGMILGDASKGVIKNIAIFGGSLTEAQTADAAAIQAALSAASLLSRQDPGKLFWLPEVQNFEDRAEQNSTGALNLGPTVMLKEGKAGYEIRFDGTSEMCKQLRKWNNKTVGVLEYDSNRKLWGRAVAGKFEGYKAKLFFNQMRVAGGQAVEEGIVICTISFLSSEEYGNQSKCLNLNEVDISTIKTQNDAILTEVAAKAGSVYKISVGIALGEHGKQFDCVAKFGANLAKVANFEAFTGANWGTAVVVTGVAINGSGYLDVTLTDSGVGAGQKIKLQLKAPSVLEASDVTDIEGVPVILTK